MTKVPSDQRRPGGPGGQGRAAARRRGQRGLQPRQHGRPERGHHPAAAEDRLPDHRGLPRHPRQGPRVAAAGRRRPTRPGGARSATRRRPLVPRYLRRGVTERMLADGRRPDRARRGPRAPASSRCSSAATSRASRSACSTPTSTRLTSERLRELAREVLGDDVAVSISAETSPLAKEYARASTTVIDVFMKLIFTDVRRPARRRPARARLRRAAELRRLRGDAAAVASTRWQQPFRIVFAGPAAGTMSSTRLRRAHRATATCSAPTSAAPPRDVSLVVDGRPFVNNTFELEHDLVINALSTEISSVGAGGGSIVSISPSGEVQVGPGSAGADPGPACYGRGGTAPTDHRRLPADRHPRPRRASPAASSSSTRTRRGARSRRSTPR